MAVLRVLRSAGRTLSAQPVGGPTLAGLLSVLLLVTCAPEPPPPSDPELREALEVGDAAVIHRVTLGGRGAVEHVVPTLLEIEIGDIVQFVPADRRVHVVAFSADGLSRDAQAFLERTQQSSSPPLMDPESRFIVTFDSAPAGAYPFTSTGNGEPVSGMIRVRPPIGDRDARDGG